MSYISYFINLDRDADRARFLQDQARRAGIITKRKRAVPINDPAWSYPKWYGPHRPQNPYWELLKTEMSVAVNHREIWERAVSENKPALVFEDDVLLSNLAGPVVETLSRHANSFDMIKLDGVPHMLRLGPEKQVGGLVVRPMLHAVPSAGAYIVSPAGARKLIKDSAHFCDHVDDFITRPRKEYRACQLMPGVAVQGMFIDETAVPQDTPGRSL